MDEIVDEGSFLFDYPLWFISSLPSPSPRAVITGTTGTGDRYVYVFTDEGFATRFLKEIPQLSHCKVFALDNPDRFVAFLDMMEKAGSTYVGIDGRLTGTRCYRISQVRKWASRSYV